MPTSAKIAKWERWLRAINRDVSQLYFFRSIYTGVTDIVEGNEHVDIDSPFFGFLSRTYADSVVMGIRRQIKTGASSISLVNLLEDMALNSTHLSRTWFFRLEPHLKGTRINEIRNRLFDEYAGRDGAEVDSARIRHDVTALRAKTLKVERLADKRIAHWDATEADIDITFQEISETLDFVGEKTKKYNRLLFAAAWQPEPLSEHPVFDVFRYPWEKRDSEQADRVNRK